MKIKIKISIDFMKERAIMALYSSLQPDDKDLPKGLELEMRAKGSCLIIDLISIKKIETLISTIDDLLACCQASTNTLSEIEFNKLI